MLYRGMKPDPTDRSKPRCGNSASSLGVRVKHEPGPPVSAYDIVAVNGVVTPMTGGMSVVSNHFETLPGHRLPRKFGGVVDDHELFMLQAASLPESLIARADKPQSPNHRAIEPAQVCLLDDYVSALHATRETWTLVGK